MNDIILPVGLIVFYLGWAPVTRCNNTRFHHFFVSGFIDPASSLLINFWYIDAIYRRPARVAAI
jgi:hypothetical protein